MQFAAMFVGGLKAVGSLIEGAEQDVMLRERERAARANQIIAQQEGTNELRIATADAEAQRRRGRRAVAEQTAGFSQSGFALTDSAAMSIEDSATAAELDALNIQYRGSLKKRAADIESENYRMEAIAAKRARKTLPLKTVIGAGTALLSGYANMQGARIS